jgi:hypothetical protein
MKTKTPATPLIARGVSFFPLLLIPLFILLIAGSCGAAAITKYQVLRLTVRDAAGRLQVAIRSFDCDGIPHLLLVDPVSFLSHDVPAASVSRTPAESGILKTPYLRAVEKYTGSPYPLQNGGATRSGAPVKGEFLTTDLCPSKRPFEREMYDAVGALSKNGPVPVAICITGVWLVKHPEQLSYLKREVAAGRLKITWVNHSYHHSYEPKVPLAQNFVLTPGTDFMKEVLDLEQLLLAEGLTPSPFFRYPGLVSDRSTMLRLRELSLIPIGSDAWLAKGESPRNGSFVLVHGNGNEPKGIRLLMPMLKEKALHLLPLQAAFRE